MLPLLAQTAEQTNGLQSLLSNQQLIMWASLTSMVIIPSVLHYWSKVRANDARAALVQDLAARGMTPDEIREVLRAARFEKGCG